MVRREFFRLTFAGIALPVFWWADRPTDRLLRPGDVVAVLVPVRRRWGWGLGWGDLGERMMVTSISGSTATVIRGYGTVATDTRSVFDADELMLLGSMRQE